MCLRPSCLLLCLATTAQAETIMTLDFVDAAGRSGPAASVTVTPAPQAGRADAGVTGARS